MEEVIEKPFGIKLNLDKDFVNSFKYLCRKYGETFKILNGVADSQLNYTDFIDNFVKEGTTVADASIDGNANVGHRDIVTLMNEMSKPHSKLLAFNKIFYELKKKYGLQTAREWMEAEWNGKYYLHDFFSSTFVSYCYAYDLDKLVRKGLYFIENFNHLPPKHLLTYVDFVGEFVSYACNRSSGAVGLPSFLVYAYYFWKKDIDSGYLGLSWANEEACKKYAEQAFQAIIYKLNQPFLRSGIQSAFTNFSIFDQSYFEALFGGKEFPDGSFVIDIEDDFMKFQKHFMKVCSNIRSVNMMTFPVLTISLLRSKDGKFVNEDFAKWACKHNMKWGDSNFFISSDVTSLSNCCRLKSNIKDLGYFNSIGGTALEVGSVKVSTINLARISYETTTKEGYLKKLKQEVILDCKLLDVIRGIIKRNIEKGLLPNYTYGLVHLENQYNTVGIIGVYETLQKFGLTRKDELGNTSYTEEGLRFAKEILKTINDTKEEFRKENNCDYMINVEQIPGERAAAILQEKDQQLYPNEIYELPLMGNQWIPLGVKCSLDEKIKLSAALDEACGGGSIAHINLEAPLTDFDTAWKLLNYVADKGVTYFAFNLRISACKNNHGFFGETCPICGGKKETTYQRIVGFLTPEKTYSKERKAEFKLRDWYEIDQKGELF